MPYRITIARCSQAPVLECSPALNVCMITKEHSSDKEVFSDSYVAQVALAVRAAIPHRPPRSPPTAPAPPKQPRPLRRRPRPSHPRQREHIIIDILREPRPGPCPLWVAIRPRPRPAPALAAPQQPLLLLALLPVSVFFAQAVLQRLACSNRGRREKKAS